MRSDFKEIEAIATRAKQSLEFIVSCCDDPGYSPHKEIADIKRSIKTLKHEMQILELEVENWECDDD